VKPAPGHERQDGDGEEHAREGQDQERIEFSSEFAHHHFPPRGASRRRDNPASLQCPATAHPSAGPTELLQRPHVLDITRTGLDDAHDAVELIRIAEYL
jgi:hypothetical protein